jgi:hypothetical protein
MTILLVLYLLVPYYTFYVPFCSFNPIFGTTYKNIVKIII